jgi:DUF4097 and DUF4098 domain-containing protein YvlB
MRLNNFERLAIALVALVGAAAFTVSVYARVSQETENFNQTVAFPSGGTLELHNFSGDVHITGTSGKDLVIKAVRRASRDRLDHIKLEVKPSGMGVRIEANKRDSGWEDHNNNVVETDFEIEVPAAARLDIDVFSSDVDIKAISGAQKVKTFSGTITLDAAAAGTSPAINAETFSGNIRARLAETAKADVSFSSFSGGFDTDLPLTLRSMNGRRNGRVSGTLSGGGGSALEFHTFSGNVRIVK